MYVGSRSRKYGDHPGNKSKPMNATASTYLEKAIQKFKSLGITIN